MPEGDFDEIHFFGDKYFEGGNDYEIYEHPRTIGHAITNKDPLQTLNMLAEIFPELQAPVCIIDTLCEYIEVELMMPH